MRQILFLLLLLTSCVKTEVIDAPLTKSVDTTLVKAHKPLPPRHEEDTTRIPIGFNPSVEDWEENEVDL